MGPAARLTPEYEINGTHDAQRRPKVVELQRLVHVEDDEGHEDGQGDDFLEDL